MERARQRSRNFATGIDLRTRIWGCNKHDKQKIVIRPAHTMEAKKFETSQIGTINFLVGPNGSGKSKFAEALRLHLGNVRMLGTDRLSGMEQTGALSSIFGDHFANGFAKNHFGHFKKRRPTRIRNRHDCASRRADGSPHSGRGDAQPPVQS